MDHPDDIVLREVLRGWFARSEVQRNAETHKRIAYGDAATHDEATAKVIWDTVEAIVAEGERRRKAQRAAKG